MTERSDRFWGVRDGRLGLLSARAALVSGVVVGALAVWAEIWWTVAAMAVVVLRALVVLWRRRRPADGRGADAVADVRAPAGD